MVMADGDGHAERVFGEVVPRESAQHLLSQSAEELIG